MIELDNKLKIERTRELMQLFNKAFNTMRVFAADHPSWSKFKRDLVMKFDEYFNSHGELVLDVEETRLLSQGIPVFEEKTKRHSLTFMLYTDGVRELLFEGGMPPDEIQGILDTFIENARIPEEERDIVCLLWERNFPHFHSVTVEDLPDAETAALLEEMVKQTPLEEMLPGAFSLGEQDQERFEQGKRAALRKMSRTAYFASLKEQLDQTESQTTIALNQRQEAKELVELIEKEYGFNPNQEMADFLIEVLHKEEMGKTYEDYARLSEHFLQRMLSFSDFKSAGHFLSGLNELADSLRENTSVEAECIDESLRTMSGREKIRGLDQVINQGMPFEPEDLYEFILLLRPSAIDPLCDLLGRTANPQVKMSIYRGLEKIARGHEQALALKLRDAPPDVARGLLNLLGTMKSKKVISYLRSFAFDRDCPLRLDIIHTMRRIGGKEVNEMAIDLLDDPDADIRNAAVRSIDLSCEPAAAGAVIRLIGRKEFAKRPMVEKKALLEYLGESKVEEGLPILLNLLKKKNVWSRSRTIETRICAAYGLGRLGTEEALEALREQKQDKNPQFGQICAAILRENSQGESLTHSDAGHSPQAG